MKNSILIKGANEHNLKNITVELPRDKFIVITGLSGSGKSSLAFDTIYAEGQRRYVESLSSYARQFLGQLEKPDVELIEGLSPAISIDQKTTSRNPRSTVGTVTEIYDYLRLLYARVGTPHCHICGQVIEKQTVDQIVESIMQMEEGSKIQIIAPVIRGKKGEHKKEIERIKKDGYVRLRVDGNIMDIEDEIDLKKNFKHDIDIIIDRLIIKPEIEKRLYQSVETALKEADGLLIVNVLGEKEAEHIYNTNFACAEHGVGIEEMEPRMFSFNSPFGACSSCSGLGFIQGIDEELLIPDDSLSLAQGAIEAYSNTNENSYYFNIMKSLADKYNQSMDTPFRELSEEYKRALLYGEGDTKVSFEFESKFSGHKEHKIEFEGVVRNLERRHKESFSEAMRMKIESFMSFTPCASCEGMRLKPEILAVEVGGLNIFELTDMSIEKILTFLQKLELSPTKLQIATPILREINLRLKFLCDVGLDYLTLSRSAGTLSGGEAQRIRLATQIGSGLCGVLYILDEPSIGLHQRDNDKLLKSLRGLCDIGNTLIVVEHDEDTIAAADYIVDIGPKAGELGGEVVFSGTYNQLLKSKKSITADYLTGRRKIEVKKQRREGNGQSIKVLGACENNLKNIDVEFPLGMFVAVTGVSGSGKSSLVNEILHKALSNKIYKSKEKVGKHKAIEGVEHIDKVVVIDQSPIGRTPRSNPATYTGVFDFIRDLFASTPDAKSRGYQKGRFSFNVKGGRCENCGGEGIIKIDMQFLSDIYVPCEICKGHRYNHETLQVKYKGKNISEVLNMTVDEALKFFENIPNIVRKIQTISDVGLGYIRLGQPSTQLSGGEAQRVKLATELSKRATGKTLYILDEPTTGLHIYDVHNLLIMLERLVDTGNSIVIIEHNLDVIKSADYIIDIGPEGGDRGGQIVATGTPEEVSEVEESYTGQFLKKILSK